MDTGVLLKTSFIAVFVLTITGAALMINKVQGAEAVLIAGIVAQLVFIVTAIYEVATSQRISRNEKWLWSIAFVLMGGITGLIYLLMGRKKVVAQY